MSEVLLVNPRRRRKTTKRRKRRATARKRNPVRRRTKARRRVTRRRRRNPALRLNVKSIQNQVTNAVPGAVGAMALDLAFGYIPLPAQFKTGIPGYLAKAVGAIGLGMVASKAGVKAATAVRMTEGALTVMMYGVGRNLASQFAPQLVPAGGMAEYLDTGYQAGGELGYYGSGYNPNYVDDPDAMGSYLPDLSDENMQTDNYGLGAYLGDENY